MPKIPVTAMLYALGLDDDEILELFYDTISIKEAKGDTWNAGRGTGSWGPTCG